MNFNKALLILAVMFFSQSSMAEPKYSAAGRDTSTVSILVPKSTSTEQLIQIINELRLAGQNQTFDQLIPPTTPGGSKGPYFVVIVFVMDNQNLANSESLKKFTKAPLTDPFVKKFADNIRAYYYYSNLHEEGSLGYNDSQIVGKGYRKLF